MATRQASIFEYEDCLTPAAGVTPLLDWEGNPRYIDRLRAEAIAEDIGKVPSGKGRDNRCLLNYTFDKDGKKIPREGKWIANWWFHSIGIAFFKDFSAEGEVRDRLNVSNSREYTNYKIVDAAAVEDDSLVFTTKDGKQYSVVISDEDVNDRYTLNWDYDPTTKGEDFLLEVIRHKLPYDMIIEAGNAPCYMSYMTPERTIEQDSHLYEIGQLCGITVKLNQDVPALKPDFEYFPVDQLCRNCICYRNKKCARGLDLTGDINWCMEWTWNRKPFKTKAKKRKSKKKQEEDEEEDDGF